MLFNLSLTACMKHKAQPPQPHLKPKDSPNPFKMANRRPPQKNKVMKSTDGLYSLLLVDDTVMAFFISTISSRMPRASLRLMNLLAEKFVNADLFEPVHLLKKIIKNYKITKCFGDHDD